MASLKSYIAPGLRAAFALALIVVMAAALFPLSGQAPGNGDKVLHFAVFYALALLGAAAFPKRRSLAWLVLALAAYGALIEVLQPLPPFGRDRDVLDWVADNVGIAFAILPILLGDWRMRRAPDAQ